MATHKVPQDVEADDKLIGFLSMKQFIFVILGIASGWLGFAFATKVHPLTIVIWIPPTVVFLVLGLYQRRDQPVEVYLASALRFYLKPRIRKWDQEGYEERVIVTAPPKIEKRYTKDFTSEEATSRLSSLSHLMDTRGWATKIASDWQNPQLAVAAASDRLVQPSQTQPSGINVQQYMQPADVMDENSSIVAQTFQSRIDQVDNSARQHAVQTMQAARSATATPTTTPDDSTTNSPVEAPTYQQYPQMHQKVVAPESVTAPVAETPVTDPAPVQTPAPKQIDTAPQQPTETSDDNGVEIQLH